MRRISPSAFFCLAVLVTACAPKAGVDDGNGDQPPANDDPCTDGAGRCEDDKLLVCEDGKFVVSEICSEHCVDGLGCVECIPGSGSCSGDEASVCLLDGSRYVSYECDPLQGLVCDFDSGACDGPCAPHRLGDSYIGCEYFPTVTGNQVRSEFEYAVIISNDNDDAVQVHIEGGGLSSPEMFLVAPHAVHVERLPWVKELKACEKYGEIECGNPQNRSALVRGGAYHLRTNAPVTVYQYNPLDYQLVENGCSPGSTGDCSYTNDASLLLPAHAMTGNYWAASWPNWWSRSADDWSGFVSVTATQDATTVTVTSPSPTWAGSGLPPLQRGVPATFTLDKGDVAQFFAKRDWQEEVDLSGMHVEANKPVQVIGGHYCTETVGMACDHMEESILPYEALANEYILTAPWSEEHTNWPFFTETYHVGERFVKVVATEPDTTIEYDPPGFWIEPPTYLANAGDVANMSYAKFRQSIRIKSNKKILVSEYMVGEQTDNIGDPAMSIAIPIEQYRSDYSFHAPVNYEKNFVNVVAPLDAQIFLDGSTTPLTGFEAAIGSTNYALLRVLLDNTGDGTHHIQGTKPFGISVYGYGQYTSYWYPGGLDLKPVSVE